MALKRFTAQDIAVIRTMAAQGYSGKTIALRQKVGAVAAQIAQSRVTPLALALQPQLQGCISGPQAFDIAR